MHIALDLDDCILDFCGGLQRAIKTEYGVDVAFDDWDLAKTLDPILGRSWWEWMRERDWLWPNFPAIEGAIGALSTLRKEGHYLEIVTSKPVWAEASVFKWLGKWRPPVQRVTIIDAGVKKPSVTNAQVLVDDKLENYTDFVSEGRRAILFARPHNTKDHEKVSTVALSWEEVLGWVRMFEEATKRMPESLDMISFPQTDYVLLRTSLHTVQPSMETETGKKVCHSCGCTPPSSDTSKRGEKEKSWTPSLVKDILPTQPQDC